MPDDFQILTLITKQRFENKTDARKRSTIA